MKNGLTGTQYLMTKIKPHKKLKVLLKEKENNI